MAVKYRCNQCGAEDNDRGPNPGAALFCWQCRAGRGQSVSDQFKSLEGMFQVDENGKFPWERA